MTSPTTSTSSPSSQPYPTLFLSHGGGPSFFIQPSHQSNPFFKLLGQGSHAEQWYRQLPKQLGIDDSENSQYGQPKAIVVISAHWDIEQPINEVRVSTKNQHTDLLYDYHGFPSYTYAPHLIYPAPGDVELSSRIIEMINKNSNGQIHAVGDHQHNFDHGVFVPLKLLYPNPSMPIIEISINHNWSPSFHILLGQTLSSLRYEQILIIGSGYIVHNLRAFMEKPEKHIEFVNSITDILTNKEKYSTDSRLKAIEKWESLPNARWSHPEEDHLVPLFSVVGAAQGSPGVPLNPQWKDDLFLQSYAFYD